MTAKEFQELRTDTQFIRNWLESIKESDEQIINETMTLMRTNPEYRTFIIDYAKGLIN